MTPPSKRTVNDMFEKGVFRFELTGPSFTEVRCNLGSSC